MTRPEHLDPPAAAARRQHVLDRWVERLVGWGCPLDYAPDRARTLLDDVLAAGYALPTALVDYPAPRGPGSTPEARRQALEALRVARERHRAAAVAAAAALGAPPGHGDTPQTGTEAHRGSTT